ncbi:hypothetical protein E8E14_007412 [Neopestalotiopsis sp. 37M]|nr:hypothetical protein E8E14_007412 [Neopestalotiopsis sp. 37M]
MDSPRPGVDLEKELTCSICTEVLYQPLTLLDCLHTYCGSCLKDWFSWQANIAENSPDPPPAGTNVSTCPSCRAPVRDTRHNATVATLLDMFLAANPDKARSEEDKLEMHEKYQPGVDVLPRVNTPEKSPEEQRLEELESQMLAQAREMSLRASGVGIPGSPRSQPQQHRHRREHQIRNLDSSDRSDRDSSRDSRHRDARHRTRREGERRQRAVSESTLQPSEEGRHRRSESQQRRSRDPSRTRRARPIEHQSSIRSLISSSSVDSLDMEREIEEFARQIQEEGLLDGLDLNNLDLTQNDDLSRRITEAYRRRQSQRTRPDTSRRATTASSRSSRADTAPLGQRPLVADRSRASSRQRANSENTRSSNSASQLDNRTRRPPITSTHLDVRDGPERRRRRTSSGARSATEPTVRSWAGDTQPATRSQTDLTLRNRTSDAEVRRPSAGDRSSSLPTTNMRDQVPVGLGLSFGERAASSTNLSSSITVDTSVISSMTFTTTVHAAEVESGTSVSTATAQARDISVGGERRHIVHDLVGGWDLHIQPLTPTLSAQPIPGLMKWSWPGPNGTKLERLVTDVVGTTAPITGPWTEAFPPEGGSGLRATANWAWYPGPSATDELMFPRGAEIREIEDVNGEWYFGCYMGAKGLFPAPYVRVAESQ